MGRRNTYGCEGTLANQSYGQEKSGRACTEPVELRDSTMAHMQVNGCKWCTSKKKYVL